MLSIDIVKDILKQKFSDFKSIDVSAYQPAHNPNILILVRRPISSFDTYKDIVAQVTVLKNDKVLYDSLITDTVDFDKFCDKIYRKIKGV